MPVNSAEYTGYGLVMRPANQNDAVKWCFDPTFIPDSQFQSNSFPGDYPLQSGNETCADAVKDIFANSTINR